MGEGRQGSRNQTGVTRVRAAVLARLLGGCCAVIACSLGPAAAQEPATEPKAPLPAEPTPPSTQKIPSFAELEAAGAVIGEVRIATRDIFDLADDKENGILYRAANALHIQTRAGVVRRQLLFKPGERVSVRLIEETERLMRSSRIFYDVSIVPVAYRDGVVDIEVKTRDTWTLEPGWSASRAGGVNKTGFTLRDTNALGTGVLIAATRSTDADRTETKYTVSQPHAFDGWTAIDYSHSQLSDGQSNAISIVRPFYALDTRWAAGFSASMDTRIDSFFNDAVKQFQDRHRRDTAETFGGWSEGLVEGWTHRYSAGLSYLKETYKGDPDLLPPPNPFPQDQTLVAPFFRYELVQDNYEKVKNRDLIERPEYFAMGTQASVQLGRSLTGLGSTQNVWLYSASANDGFRLPSNWVLLGSTSVSGQTGYGPLDRYLASGSMRFYGHPDNRTLTFVSLAADILRDPNSSQLVLGGDTGLRGYPRNYQTGDRRVVFNVEERVYTDWYPFRLFRVGGAVYYDLGRAWSGPGESPSSARWLNDVGFGLRILSARSSFGNVLHVDLAFPLNRDPNIKSFQFLVQTKLSL
jgi:hypothetical protein